MQVAKSGLIVMILQVFVQLSWRETYFINPVLDCAGLLMRMTDWIPFHHLLSLGLERFLSQH